MNEREWDNQRRTSGTVTEEFDWDGEPSVTVAVLEAVSELSGRDFQSLDRLHETINPDALNKLFDTTADDQPRTIGEVSFVYEGFEITIHSDGRLVVSEQNGIASIDT